MKYIENVVAESDLYTYDAAITRYERELHHEWLCRQRKLQEIRQQQKEKRKAEIKQKLIGIFLIIIGIFFLLFGEGGGFFIAAAGLVVALTKKNVLK